MHGTIVIAPKNGTVIDLPPSASGHLMKNVVS